MFNMHLMVKVSIMFYIYRCCSTFFKIFIWTFNPLLSSVRHLAGGLHNVALLFLGTTDTHALNLQAIQDSISL